jgi:hypothetical protein
VRNSTVAFNSSDTSKGGAGGDPAGMAGQDTKGQGGGVRRDGGTVNAVSSIFADNTAAGGQADFSGNFALARHNLLEDNTGSNLAGANPDANGNKVGTGGFPFNPHLLPLDDYGGPTQTVALKPDSIAIDAGANPDALTTDQRGFKPRAVGAAIDIGAFEFGADAPPPVAPPPTVIVVPLPLHRVITRLTRVKGKTRLDVFDAETKVKRGNVFPFGRSRGRIRVVQADVNGDSFADVLVLGVRGGRLRQRIFSGVDLRVIG